MQVHTKSTLPKKGVNMDKKKDKKQNPNPNGAQQPASDENAKGKDLYDNDMHNETVRRS